VNPATVLVHLDDDARHRLRVSADIFYVLVGYRFRVLAEQFAAARDRNRLWPCFRVFDVLHGHPCDSLQTFVMRSALEARRPEVCAPMTMSVDVWRAADTEARDLKSNALIARDVRDQSTGC
jgi:hypothetical protein